ncbi:bacterial Ig-like domain-containing protein [Leuconostoc sp. MS02]|uniref:Bacterial Ig-like domain-containing protein n=1 Tax=Leuconostoc aquikimchii TaxID=3236804 RepID=A0ABV3S5M0_9LACO
MIKQQSHYKLYKSGKLWVSAMIATGMITISASPIIASASKTDGAAISVVDKSTVSSDGNTLQKNDVNKKEITSSEPITLSAPENVTYNVGDQINLLDNVTASDNADGTKNNVTVTNIVDESGQKVTTIPTDKAATYTVTYTVTNLEGQSTTKNTTVVVKSTVAESNTSDASISENTSSDKTSDSESISSDKAPDSESTSSDKAPDSESTSSDKTSDSESISSDKAPDSESTSSDKASDSESTSSDKASDSESTSSDKASDSKSISSDKTISTDKASKNITSNPNDKDKANLKLWVTTTQSQAQTHKDDIDDILDQSNQAADANNADTIVRNTAVLALSNHQTQELATVKSNTEQIANQTIQSKTISENLITATNNIVLNMSKEVELAGAIVNDDKKGINAAQLNQANEAINKIVLPKGANATLSAYGDLIIYADNSATYNQSLSAIESQGLTKAFRNIVDPDGFSVTDPVYPADMWVDPNPDHYTFSWRQSTANSPIPKNIVLSTDRQGKGTLYVNELDNNNQVLATYTVPKNSSYTSPNFGMTYFNDEYSGIARSTTSTLWTERFNLSNTGRTDGKAKATSFIVPELISQKTSYVDLNGKELQPSYVQTGLSGQKYTTANSTEAVIPGYYATIPMNASGTMSPYGLSDGETSKTYYKDFHNGVKYVFTETDNTGNMAVDVIDTDTNKVVYHIDSLAPEQQIDKPVYVKNNASYILRSIYIPQTKNVVYTYDKLGSFILTSEDPAFPDTKPQQYTNNPTDPTTIQDQIVPNVPGYTAFDKDNNQLTPGSVYNPTDIGKDTTIHYINNMQKATVSYIDSATGEILKVDNITGPFDSTSPYRTDSSIQAFKDAGYVVDSNTYPSTGLVFDRDDTTTQTAIVKLTRVRTNDKPEITAPETVSYKVGDQIDPLANVTGTDTEDKTTDVAVAKIVDPAGNVVTEIPNDKPGEYTVTYTTTDKDGNTTTKDATITVVSNDKPVIAAPDATYKVGDQIDPLANVTSTDTEDGKTDVTVSKIVDPEGNVVTEIPNDKPGEYTVTYTTTDKDGNTTTKDATITVVSNDKPVIAAPDATYKVGDQIDPLANVTGTDTEDGKTDVTVSKIVDPEGNVVIEIPNDKPGEYTVTYTTTDKDGNTTTKDATITVVSNDKPVIAAPDATYKVGDQIDPLANVSGTDTEDKTTDVTVSKIVDPAGNVVTEIPNDKPGEYTVTYTTTDKDGNTTTKDATITVVSNDKPVIAAPDATYKVGDQIDPLANVTGTDTEDGKTDVTVAKIVDPAGNVVTEIPNDKPGEYTVTYTTTDKDGNTTTKDATITVVSNDKPVIAAPDATYKVGDQIDPLANVSGTDTEDGKTDVTVSKIVDPEGNVVTEIPNDKPGEYTVTYTTTDKDGNTTTKDATITVVSNDKPVIAAPDATYKVGDQIDPLANVTGTDTEDGKTDVTVSKIVDPEGNVVIEIPNDKPGEYTVTYTTTDKDGNTTTKDATITVVSNDKPVIAAPDATYKVGDQIDPLANVSGTDTEDKTTDVTVSKIVDPAGNVVTEIPNDKPGEYTVTYTTTDKDGNTTTKDATITVVSNDKPVIAAPDATYKVGDQIDPLANVTGTDTEDGKTDVTVAKIVDPAGNVVTEIPNDKPGEYTVTYTTTDKDGNTTTKDATITVVSNDKPVIAAPDATYKVGDQIDPLANVSGTDTEDKTTDVTVSKIVDPEGNVVTEIPNDKPGEYTVTYTTTDKDGNTTTKDATITVVSNDKPVIAAPDATYKVGDQIDPLANVAGTDTEDGKTDVTVAKIVDPAGNVVTEIPNDKPGEYTVTYTTTDKDGNTTTKDATITVVSNDKPVIAAPDATYKVGDQIDPLANVKSTDTEDGTTTVTVSKIVDPAGNVVTEIPNDKPGEYTVTYTTTDKDGNTTTKDATITVVSNDKPVIAAPDTTYKVGDQIDPLANVKGTDTEDKTTDVTVSKIVDPAGNVVTEIPNDKPGEYTVTYTTTDKDGNTTTKDATITVVSNDKPVIEAPDATYKVGDQIDPLANVSGTDTEDKTTDVTVSKIVDPAGNVVTEIPNDKPGEYTVTYTTTDKDGNTTTKDATITVVSNDKPVITAPDATYKVGDKIDPLANVTGTDTEDKTTDVTVAKIVDPAGNVVTEIPNDKPGEYTVTYTTTDKDGNTTTKDATITVVSNDKPVIAAPDTTYKVGDQIDPLANVTGTDTEDKTTDVTVAKIVDPAGNVVTEIPNDKPGEYTVTYTTTDKDGNTTTKDATITVVSNDKPEITAPDATYKVGDQIDPLANVKGTDTEDKTTDVTVAKIVDPAGNVVTEIPNDKPGEYTVTYTTTDKDGNTTTKNVIITVVSNDKPVIEAPDATYKVGDQIDPLANVKGTDTEDGTTTVTVSKIVDPTGNVISEIPNDKPGEYTVTYTTTDKDGNITTKDAIITVVSNEVGLENKSKTIVAPITIDRNGKLTGKNQLNANNSLVRQQGVLPATDVKTTSFKNIGMVGLLVSLIGLVANKKRRSEDK